MTVRVEAIDATSVPSASRFLHDNLNQRVSTAAWERSVNVPWRYDSPNHGYMLLDDDDRIVGVYLAFYSERKIDERMEQFCNLGAWCVLPSHRRHSLRLLNALLGQDGYHFTDLSPSGNVVPLNIRLGFEHLDTTTALVPNLPWPSRPGRFRISSDSRVIENILSGVHYELYRDHRRSAAVRHVVIVEADRWCYVIFRRDRRKNLPFFVTFLHVSDPELFQRASGALGRRLLIRFGALMSIAELRVVTNRPRRSLMLRSPRPRMFRSPTLDSNSVDYLYSELVCVAW